MFVRQRLSPSRSGRVQGAVVSLLRPAIDPRLVSARPTHLPRVIPLSATFPIPHRDRVGGAFGVDRDHRVPVAAMWAAELRAGFQAMHGVAHRGNSIYHPGDRAGQPWKR